MAPCCTLLSRSNTDASSAPLSRTVIAGIAVACAITSGAVLWLIIYWMRKRGAAKRADARGAAFLSVRGVVNEGKSIHSGLISPPTLQATTFSRAQLTPSIIMPAKAVLSKDATRDEIIAHYTALGVLPRPFSPVSMLPPNTHDSQNTSTSPSPGSKRTSRLPPLRPKSVMSLASVRSSTYSHRRLSSAGSSLTIISEDARRRVRQAFKSTLLDELTLTSGERVSVVQSFDDGWCVVGRDTHGNGDVELGAVPAWVFLKPVKGLRTERPIRTTSLGVTVGMDKSRVAREDVISWSNF
ncbi:uncharacterized protein FIBRA_05225 [Fibroporia radiculosa]|uniref:SH3 domain-containing protein n=1 Tax=Fibroporia radiculosa TaxID=599839 RepID=J4GQL6_9APHY|nr:uncharacterized protein FIBRA_05225 [Fibroporia radiculosa]CCM03105.1 predicted protein [Fibroporia radiculosa]